MAKKKKQNRKKHGEVQETSGEFMSEVPESNDGSWSEEKPLSHLDSDSNGISNSNHEEQFEENSDSIVDPIEEQMNLNDDQDFESNQNHQMDIDHEESFGGDSVGSFLAEHRESRGISLKNISQSTKISLTNLEYLESDQLEALPDRAYVIGYVKSYARALNVDQKIALSLLDETYQALGAVPREQEIVIPQALNPTQDHSNIPFKLIGTIVTGLALIIGLVIFFISKGNDDTQGLPDKVEAQTTKKPNEIKPQTLNAETPLQSKVESTPTSPTEPQEVIPVEEPPALTIPTKETVAEKPPVQKVKKEANPAVKEEPKQQIKEKQVKKIETKKEDIEIEKKKFYPLAGTLYSFDDKMSEDRQAELLPSNFKVSPSATNQNIYITAVTGDSWLTYKSDDDQIRKFVLKKGRSLLIRADEARVFLGNLSALKIFLNNKPLNISSPTGVKSLVFPQENAENYAMPLFIYKEDGTVQTSSDYIKENP